jgi:hypothetical protein
VYYWQTAEYKRLLTSATKPPALYLRLSPALFAIPAFLKHSIPIPGRLHGPHIRLLCELLDWFDGPQLTDIATNGIDFESSLPPGARPHAGVRLWRGSDDEFAFWRDHVITKGLRAGQIRRVAHHELARAVVHPIFCVPKVTPPGMPKKFRDIIDFAKPMDLSRWGRPDLSFNDSTPLHLRPSISPGKLEDVCLILEFLVRHGVSRSTIHIGKIDMAEAYKHARIKAQAQLQQAFLFARILYAVTSMQFGTAASASVMCRFTNLFQAAFRHYGIGCATFIDDLLSIAVSAAQEASALALQRAILRFCGIKTNEDKSDHHGQRKRDFVGILIDLDAWTLSILPRSLDKLRARCHEVLRRTIVGRRSLLDDDASSDDEEAEDRADAPAHDDITGPPDSIDDLRRLPTTLLLKKLAGSMNFSASVIRPMKPAKAYVYALSKVPAPRLGPKAAAYMRTVLGMLDSCNSTPIIHPPFELERQHDMRLASDASGTHFGAVAFADDGSMCYLQESWADMHAVIRGLDHINDQELVAHLAMIYLLLPQVGDGYRVIPTLADNTATVAWVNKLFARMASATTTPPAQALRSAWLGGYAVHQHCHGVYVTATYIRSADNVLPDALSRPLTHQHVFDAYVAQLLAAGKKVTRVRVSGSWLPPSLRAD